MTDRIKYNRENPWYEQIGLGWLVSAAGWFLLPFQWTWIGVKYAGIIFLVVCVAGMAFMAIQAFGVLRSVVHRFSERLNR